MAVPDILLRIGAALARAVSGRTAPQRRPPGRTFPPSAPGRRRPTRSHGDRRWPTTDRQPPYAGDFTGTTRIRYSPQRNGRGDPGEIVWTWVPYEEDHTQGKDRPVLVIGTDGPHLLALMLTSKDHDRDAADESRHGRHWMDIGTGPWDRQRRPSEVRLDRVLRLWPETVRREAAELDRARFAQVAEQVRALHGWPS